MANSARLTDLLESIRPHRVNERNASKGEEARAGLEKKPVSQDERGSASTTDAVGHRANEQRQERLAG
jgi:hypothetical protein